MSRSRPDLAPASSVAEPCPVCGGPAEVNTDDEGWPIARCSICKGDWRTYDDWDDAKLQLVPSSEAPPLDTMKRAEAVTVWKSYRERMTELLPVAKDLTVTSAEEKDKMALARTTRMSLRDIRLAIEDTHKELKAEALKTGQALDKEKRELLAVIEPLEARLLQQEKFEALQLADAKMRLQQEREDMLRPYIPDQAEFLEATADLAKMPETAFYHLRDGYEAAFVAREKKAKEERLAAEEAARTAKEELDRLRLEAETSRKALAAAETERLRVAEVARREQARLQAIADAAELEARTIREEQERQKRLAYARQTAQQGTDAQKLEEIAKRCASPSWPAMSEPWAHDIIHDDHVRLTLAGLACWIRGQIAAHQPK